MILFYVSGHGYGHATRAGAVIKALLDRPRFRSEICIRTTAPSWLFDPRACYLNAAIEPAVIESTGALRVEPEASAESLRQFSSSLDEVISRETAWVRANGVRAIFADIPFLAGYVGQSAGVPSIAGGNFLWNWILEGHQGVDVVTEGYRRCTLGLRYPLSHDEGWDVFPRSEQVPLVTPRSQRDRREIRRELGLESESRPAVLIGGRARLEPEAEARLRESGSGFVFLTADMLPNYHDLVRAADLVVSKAGYSIVAECIAEGRPILYPPRTGFREEEMLMQHAARYMRCLPIHPALWSAGSWGEGLRQLVAMPEPPDTIDTHGAQTCAEILIRTAA